MFKNKKMIYCLLLAFLVSIELCACACNQQTSPTPLRETLQKLGPETPFVDFPIVLSGEEKRNLNEIRITGAEYNNFGKLDELIPGATMYFTSMSNDDESSQSISHVLNRIVTDVVSAARAETAWVTVRTFKREEAFIPRWHTDGYYYSPYKGLAYKVAITLKGAGTLFYDMPKEEREAFYKIHSDDGHGNSIEGRGKLAKLIGASKAHQPKPYTGVAFIVGDPDTAAVHSEPPIDEDRIFISVLPGSKEQIQELRDRWEKR